MPSEKSKTCMVPSCKASNSDHPDRIFFTVPETKKKQWLEIVGCDENSIEQNKRQFCCENHFSIKRDIVGYHFYKVFGGRIRLEDHAYPYKNLGNNVSIPRSRVSIPIIAAEPPKPDEKDEPGDESVDPLATPIDNDDDSGDHDLDDTGFDMSHDSDVDETNCESSQLNRSEEIVATSDVPMQGDDDYSESDDIPLKVKKTDDNSKTPNVSNGKKKNKLGDSSAVTNEYNCSQCGKNLSSSTSLKRHVKTFHVVEKKRTISCPDCEMVFVLREEYVKHKLVHKKPIVCDVCHREFRTRFLLKSHYVQHVNEKPFLCEICSRPFARMASLQKHRFTHVTEKTCICDTCGKGFSAKFLLKQHIHQYHTTNTTVMCSSCSKTFTSTSLLNIHIKAYHDEVNPYKCETCKLHFKHPSALLRHRKRFHDPRSTFSCEFCPKKFTKGEMLVRHLKTHPNKPTLTFDIKVNVKPKSVKTESVYKCEECGITLCRPDRLRAHLANLHNPKNPHRCSTCRQTFPTEVLMNQHVMRSHAPEHEYIYKCYICPKKYNQEAALKRHVKLHTDPKKPVTCELCGKTLGRPNRLKPHMRALHNPNNPYKCGICFQTFREGKMLLSHTTQMHDQSILCQYCNKSFGKQEGLQQHLRRNHSDIISVVKEIKSENVE